MVYLSIKTDLEYIDLNGHLRIIERLSGMVDRIELAKNMKVFSQKAKEQGLRPGETNIKNILSSDQKACLNTLMPHGNIPPETLSENITFSAITPISR